MLNVLLMVLPSVVTIVMQATRISASMTAYSTAVGPSSLTRNRMRRFLISLAIGLWAGWTSHLHNLLSLPDRPSDYYWAHYAAKKVLRGENPYTIVPDRAFIPYPLTTALVGLPLSFLPAAAAAAVFNGASAMLLAWGLLKDLEYWRLLVFVSFPYRVALDTNQWSPLLFAVALSPGLLPLVLAKPQYFIPVALPRLTFWRVLGCVALGGASLWVMPAWPWIWRSQLGPYTGYVPLWCYPVLWLALLRYRDPVAWQFLLIAAMPQKLYAYDVLLLWMLPRCKIEMSVLTAGSWVLALLGFALGISSGGTLPYFYLPVLCIVLSPTWMHWLSMLGYWRRLMRRSIAS